MEINQTRYLFKMIFTYLKEVWIRMNCFIRMVFIPVLLLHFDIRVILKHKMHYFVHGYLTLTSFIDKANDW